MLRLRRGDQIEVFKILNWFEKTNERSSEQQHIVACCKSLFFLRGKSCYLIDFFGLHFIFYIFFRFSVFMFELYMN